MKKLFLVFLFGIGAVILLRWVIQNKLKEAYEPISALGKNPADLGGLLQEMMADPKMQEYMEFARPYFPRQPTIEEKDDRVFACFGEAKFDMTDLKNSPFVQGLKNELQVAMSDGDLGYTSAQ